MGYTLTEQYNRALDTCKEGLLRATYHEEDSKIVLFCYTKQCFYGKDTWNETTKSHRGALYYDGVQVNKPFQKIFNLNEVPETKNELVLERMENEDYSIQAKANGHLFIVSAFVDDKNEQHVVMHTKGSLPNKDNNLLRDDISVFSCMYGKRVNELVRMFPNSTWMFEAIVEHDIHTMYKEEVDYYGEHNCFVLLGGNVFNGKTFNEVDYSELKDVSDIIECPVIKEYEDIEGKPKDWLEHTNTEGYVIKFYNGDRVKVKTREYWKLRFKNDLNTESILNKLKNNFDIKLKLPEEKAKEIADFLYDRFKLWYLHEHIKINEIYSICSDAIHQPLTKKERGDLFKKEEYNMIQKQFIAMLSDGTNINKITEKSWYNKNLKSQFNNFAMGDQEEYNFLNMELKEIVDNI